MTRSEDSTTGTNRIRTLTEQGKIYQVELLKDQLSSAGRAWRKQMNNVSNLVVDSSNVDVSKSEQSFLEADGNHSEQTIVRVAREKFQ